MLLALGRLVLGLAVAFVGQFQIALPIESALWCLCLA